MKIVSGPAFLVLELVSWWIFYFSAVFGLIGLISFVCYLAVYRNFTCFSMEVMLLVIVWKFLHL